MCRCSIARCSSCHVRAHDSFARIQVRYGCVSVRINRMQRSGQEFQNFPRLGTRADGFRGSNPSPETLLSPRYGGGARPSKAASVVGVPRWDSLARGSGAGGLLQCGRARSGSRRGGVGRWCRPRGTGMGKGRSDVARPWRWRRHSTRPGERWWPPGGGGRVPLRWLVSSYGLLVVSA